jgi:hypothetical protein
LHRLRLFLERSDRVDRHIGRFEQCHQRVEAQAALRIAAVGIQHHDFPAVLLTGAAEIEADGIVQRGAPARGQLADALDQTGEVALRIASASHLAREVDERHVDSVGQRRQEFDHCLPGESKIEQLTFTHVE